MGTLHEILVLNLNAKHLRTRPGRKKQDIKKY
jgi:hypothetical protein